MRPFVWRRMESTFYELSHDRLAESVFAARRAKLPKSVRRALWASGVAALLLSRGADRNSRGSKGLTPLLAARSSAMRQVLRSHASS